MQSKRCGVTHPTEEALYLYDVAILYALLADRALRSNVSVRNGTWLFQQALGLNFTGTLLWDMALSTSSRTELHRYTALEPGSFNRLSYLTSQVHSFGTWLFQRDIALNFAGTLPWNLALWARSRTQHCRYSFLESGNTSRL